MRIFTAKIASQSGPLAATARQHWNDSFVVTVR
jgi:hypothetical protein